MKHPFLVFVIAYISYMLLKVVLNRQIKSKHSNYYAPFNLTGLPQQFLEDSVFRNVGGFCRTLPLTRRQLRR